jgi:hypothetical protein
MEPMEIGSCTVMLLGLFGSVGTIVGGIWMFVTYLELPKNRQKLCQYIAVPAMAVIALVIGLVIFKVDTPNIEIVACGSSDTEAQATASLLIPDQICPGG